MREIVYLFYYYLVFIYLFIFFYLLGPIKAEVLKTYCGGCIFKPQFFLLKYNCIPKRDVFGTILYHFNGPPILINPLNIKDIQVLETIKEGITVFKILPQMPLPYLLNFSQHLLFDVD